MEQLLLRLKLAPQPTLSSLPRLQGEFVEERRQRRKEKRTGNIFELVGKLNVFSCSRELVGKLNLFFCSREKCCFSFNCYWERVISECHSSDGLARLPVSSSRFHLRLTNPHLRKLTKSCEGKARKSSKAVKAPLLPVHQAFL